MQGENIDNSFFLPISGQWNGCQILKETWAGRGGEREKKVRSCQGGVLCEQKGGGGRNERVDVYGLVALEMSSKEIEGEE